MVEPEVQPNDVNLQYGGALHTRARPPKDSSLLLLTVILSAGSRGRSTHYQKKILYTETT